MSIGGVGAVIIGRNEGERLRRSLQSIVPFAGTSCVYVDSGSSDGSVELARSMGITVVELDLAQPFTAARARNAGWKRLLEIDPSCRFVQFVDGDCEVHPDWWDVAVKTLLTHHKLAVVCGRRRERYPEASVYNQLCDMEWNTPVGAARTCGGDCMMRIAALREVGGYNDSIIAGEEPELCVRLRLADWGIFRVDAEMTLHDAAMTRFGQWWKRAVRAGHAYAEGFWRHGLGPTAHNRRDVITTVLWGIFVPVTALGLAFFTYGISLALLLGYPLIAWRSYRYMLRRGAGAQAARRWGMATTLAKFAQAQGLLKFCFNRLTGRSSRIIEYKGPAAPAAARETS